jgi:hypothetical protein
MKESNNGSGKCRILKEKDKHKRLVMSYKEKSRNIWKRMKCGRILHKGLEFTKLGYVVNLYKS